ncbi:MAG: hypothetical protein ABL888_16870 [Pirellulaceae bacterium]
MAFRASLPLGVLLAAGFAYATTLSRLMYLRKFLAFLTLFSTFSFCVSSIPYLKFMDQESIAAGEWGPMPPTWI